MLRREGGHDVLPQKKRRRRETSFETKTSKDTKFKGVAGRGKWFVMDKYRQRWVEAMLALIFRGRKGLKLFRFLRLLFFFSLELVLSISRHLRISHKLRHFVMLALHLIFPFLLFLTQCFAGPLPQSQTSVVSSSSTSTSNVFGLPTPWPFSAIKQRRHRTKEVTKVEELYAGGPMDAILLSGRTFVATLAQSFRPATRVRFKRCWRSP